MTMGVTWTFHDSRSNQSVDDLEERIEELEKAVDFYKPMFLSLVVLLVFFILFFCCLIVPSRRRMHLKQFLKVGNGQVDDGKVNLNTRAGKDSQSDSGLGNSPENNGSSEESDKCDKQLQVNQIQTIAMVSESRGNQGFVIEQPDVGGVQDNEAGPGYPRRLPDFSEESETSSHTGTTASSVKSRRIGVVNQFIGDDSDPAANGNLMPVRERKLTREAVQRMQQQSSHSPSDYSSEMSEYYIRPPDDINDGGIKPEALREALRSTVPQLILTRASNESSKAQLMVRSLDF